MTRDIYRSISSCIRNDNKLINFYKSVIHFIPDTNPYPNINININILCKLTVTSFTVKLQNFFKKIVSTKSDETIEIHLNNISYTAMREDITINGDNH